MLFRVSKKSIFFSFLFLCFCVFLQLLETLPFLYPCLSFTFTRTPTHNLLLPFSFPMTLQGLVYSTFVWEPVIAGMGVIGVQTGKNIDVVYGSYT